MSVEGCKDVTVQYSGVRENKDTLRYKCLEVPCTARIGTHPSTRAPASHLGSFMSAIQATSRCPQDTQAGCTQGSRPKQYHSTMALSVRQAAFVVKRSGWLLYLHGVL